MLLEEGMVSLHLTELSRSSSARYHTLYYIMFQRTSIFSYIYMNIHNQELYHADTPNSPAPPTKCFKTTRHYHSVCKMATIQGYCKSHMSGSKCVTKLHTHLNGEGSPLPLSITTIVRKASIFCSLI